MTQEFVAYEQALKLKQLGFDEPCLDQYNNNAELWGLKAGFIVKNQNLIEGSCSSPLYQQAFRFFREKKLSDSCICRYQSIDDGGVYYYYVINHDFGIEETKHLKEGFYSYEEAELACLDKLIEIVESNNKQK